MLLCFLQLTANDAFTAKSIQIQRAFSQRIVLVSKYLLILAAWAMSLGLVAARADESTRAVQEELRRRHLFYGNVDGRETPGLTAAIKHYQERKGFRQTGIADPETLRSMGITEEPMLASELPDVPVLRSDRGLAPGEVKVSETSMETTTRSGPLLMPPELEIRNYLREYLDACQGQNILAEIAYYAPQVAYFDRGVVTKTFIRNESVAYRQRWPERTYVLDDAIALAPSGNKVKVTYSLKFSIGNSVLSQSATGITRNSVLLDRASDQRWEIAGIQEERLRGVAPVTTATAKRRSRTRSRDATTTALRKVGRTVRKFFR